MEPGKYLVGLGFTGEIYKIGDEVVKIPKVFYGDPERTAISREQIDLERKIYQRLGNRDPGIIEYRGDDAATGGIKLAYAGRDNLREYILKTAKPDDSFRNRWIECLIGSFYYIYCQKIWHGDINLDNILVERDQLKIIDFANGKLFNKAADMSKEYAMDADLQTEILHLGCVIYSIATWKVYFYDYWKDMCWPTQEELPLKADNLYERITLACLTHQYSSIEGLYNDFRTRTNAETTFSNHAT